jgi:hypothetical protein
VADQMSEWRSACVIAPYPPELLPNTPRRPEPPHLKRCSIAGSISRSRKSSQAPIEAELMFAAEPGEAIGKGDGYRWHALFPDQPIEPFRQVLAEADPIRVGEAAAREADKIHEQGQSLSVLPSRDNDSEMETFICHPERDVGAMLSLANRQTRSRKAPSAAMATA